MKPWKQTLRSSSTKGLRETRMNVDSVAGVLLAFDKKHIKQLMNLGM